MSVHTLITQDEIQDFLAPFAFKRVQHFSGIADGITNTIYRVNIDDKDYVLTIFEELTAEDLHFFIALMDFLHQQGLVCPKIIHDNHGQAVHLLKGKPAMLCEFLPGATLSTANNIHCQAVGSALGQLHQRIQHFPELRNNPYDLAWHIALAKRVSPHLTAAQQKLLTQELHHQQAQDYSQLPMGICHMDLFIDNVLFAGDQLTGLLDFYFACTNYYLLDLAVAMCAWSISSTGINKAHAEHLLVAYQAERALTAAELPHLPNMQRYAALHFWLTRLRDKYLVPAKEGVLVKDPNQFEKLLAVLTQ
jgi:homoserine kinase type II